MVRKIPPPPPIANVDPAFNRWLLELTSILEASGGIDPNAVAGLSDLTTQVQTNTDDIAALGTVTGDFAVQLASLQGQIGTLNDNIATINSEIAALGSRSQVFTGAGAPAAGLGNVSDWYANPAGAVGARIYIKTAPTVWTAFPF